MKQKNIEEKVKLISLLIVLGAAIGFSIYFIKLLILKMPVQPIYSSMTPFKDFTDTFKASDSPYSMVGGARNYFPIVYVVMRLLKLLFTKDMVAYIVSFCTFVVILFWFYSYVLKDKIKNKYIYIAIFVLFTYPMWFLFQRANVEYFVLIVLILFVIQLKKEEYYLASFTLAIAVGMKLYPALFALLFLNRKQYKAFFSCVILSIRNYSIRVFYYGRKN